MCRSRLKNGQPAMKALRKQVLTKQIHLAGFQLQSPTKIPAVMACNGPVIAYQKLPTLYHMRRLASHDTWNVLELLLLNGKLYHLLRLDSLFCSLTSFLCHHSSSLCPSRAINEHGFGDYLNPHRGARECVSHLDGHLEPTDTKRLTPYRELHDESSSDVTIEYRHQPDGPVLGVWHANAETLSANSRFFASCLNATSVSAWVRRLNMNRRSLG